jgi:ubiquinone/menaquinone biosynthesis C-methylase UbiE
MSWLKHLLEFPRVPEAEVMDDSGEVEAYSSAAAQKYLDGIDDTFVDHALRLVAPKSVRREQGKVLDIGCGPGQIVLKMAQRLPRWTFSGVDRSRNMIAQAVLAREKLGWNLGVELSSRVQFFLADGNALPFPDGIFDFVCCNSVLHHLQQPVRFLGEIARVAKTDAAILLRDLARPPRIIYPLHVRWYGRRYPGLMYKLYCDSVRAAYTPEELAQILSKSPLKNVRVFRRGQAHLGFERTAS